MKRVHIHLAERQEKAINEIAKELEITKAEIYRRAIDEYIGRHEAKSQNRNKAK